MRGRKFYVGNLQGDAGDSLVIELEGDKAGLGYDHATGESRGSVHVSRTPRRTGQPARLPPGAGRRRALARQCGTGEPASARKPKGPPIDTLGPATAKWDYWSADGRLLACVYRYDPPSGKTFSRAMWCAAATARRPIRPLYNLPGLASSEAVVVVEGEKCAQALIDAGICRDDPDGRRQRAGREDRSHAARRQARADLAGPRCAGTDLCGARGPGGARQRRAVLRDPVSAGGQTGQVGCRGRARRGLRCADLPRHRRSGSPCSRRAARRRSEDGLR